MTFFFNNVHRPCLLLFIAAFSAFLGCSETANAPEGPQELIEKKTTSSGFTADTPEEELLSEGKRLYESGLYSVAKEAFESLRDGYPNGAYLEFAEIKVSDSLFESGEYESAKQGFEEFVRNRPTSSEASYALFRAGRASEELFTGVGRDPTPIKQAKELFERVIKEYPSSAYASESRRKIAAIDEKLRSYESEVAAYYRRHERDSAAEKREAIASAPLPKVDVGSSDSPQIVTASRINEIEPSKASIALQKNTDPNPETKSVISRIVCDEPARRVIVYLRSTLHPFPLETTRTGDSVKIELPDLGDESRLQSCLGVDNFKIAEGTATWDGVSEVITMILTNPSRIMIQAAN